MTSAVGYSASTYNRVWGQSPQRNPGAEPLVREAKPPGTEALLAFGRSTEASNLLTFLKFENAKKSDICINFARNYG